MRIKIISFSRRGSELAKTTAEVLNGHECRVYAKTAADVCGAEKIVGSASKWTEEAFGDSDAIVYIGATGIAVRYIAPFIKDKTTDPAIISMDERGRFVISLLSGHIGGANELAKEIAEKIGAVPVITTATDIGGHFSVDSFATKNNMHIGSMPLAKTVSSAIVDGKRVGLSTDIPFIGNIPGELNLNGDEDIGIFISYLNSEGTFPKTLKLTPLCHVLGIGCRRGTSKEAIRDLVNEVFEKENLSLKSIRTVASIDLKKDEKGLLEFCKDMNIEPVFFCAEELNSLPDMNFTPSEMVRSVTGTDNVCERSAVSASDGGDMIIRKTSKNGVTLSVVREPVKIDLTGA